MKGFSCVVLACALYALTIAQAQTVLRSSVIRGMRPFATNDTLPLDAAFKPFYHGVASGDPLQDRVIIWTRVTPDDLGAAVSLNWAVATDTGFAAVVASGTANTDSTRDFTVKVDVPGLSAGTTYYYRFQYQGIYSLTGRTRTAAATATHLRFAVVSCNNYEAGYFNGFEAIAKRNDLDAVLHLGDYIYEYEPDAYGDTTLTRSNLPEKEVVTLSDYRTRYSLYRLDPQLRKAHQQQAFISIWDDHESANDSYKDGAENHQPATEGDWNTRKMISKKVYFEWMPIRETTDTTIYRAISYGNLAEVVMLDTRLDGRTAPPANFDDPDSPVRRVLSSAQRTWFENKLRNSTAKWKIIGNQVLFSQTNLGFAAVNAQGAPAPTDINAIRATENLFIDNWESYPTERTSLIDTIALHADNVVFVTGDSHASWAFDIAKEVVVYPNPLAGNLPTASSGYTATTGAGSVAVEFGTPSISSANFDEALGAAQTGLFEAVINQPQPLIPTNPNYNPHLKYVDLDRHGYILLNLTDSLAQADYFYVTSLKTNNGGAEAYSGTSPLTYDGDNHLSLKTTAAAGKSIQEIPAPDKPANPTAIADAGVAVFAVSPNPSHGQLSFHYALSGSSEVEITLYDLTGKPVAGVLRQRQLAGPYSVTTDVSGLPVGSYVYRIRTDSGVATGKVQIVR